MRSLSLPPESPCFKRSLMAIFGYAAIMPIARARALARIRLALRRRTKPMTKGETGRARHRCFSLKNKREQSRRTREARPDPALLRRVLNKDVAATNGMSAVGGVAPPRLPDSLFG